MNAGLLNEIATMFYNLNDMNVTVLDSKNDSTGNTAGPIHLDAQTVVVRYRLDFDNRDYVILISEIPLSHSLSYPIIRLVIHIPYM